MSNKKEESEKLKRKIASKKQFDLKCKVCHKKYGKFFITEIRANPNGFYCKN